MQTCRSIATATRERIVWLEALRRVCVVNSIFLPTFPLEEMSQRALEHAATSPSRFLNLFMKKNDTVHPFATRLFDSRRSSDDGMLQDCCLIPGGRFLLSRSIYSIIHLWDLGYTSEAMIKPFPIASMTSDSAQIVTIQPTRDDMGLQIVLSGSPEYVFSCLHSCDDVKQHKRVDGVSIYVYEVYPLSIAPTFRMVASLENMNNLSGAISSARDLIAVHHNNAVTVWNFVLDSMVTWDVSIEYEDVCSFPCNSCSCFPDDVIRR